MLALIIAPVLFGILIFIYVRTIKYVKALHIDALNVLFVLLGIFIFSGVIFVTLGFVLPSTMMIKNIFSKLGFYWVGIVLYIIIGSCLAQILKLIIWLIFRKKKNTKIAIRMVAICFVIIFTVSMSVFGIANAHDLKVTNYDVRINKYANIRELNIALISDLHLGYNTGVKEIEDMVNKINNLNPDVVILAGDIFDNNYDAIDKPERIIELLSSIRSKYGKYATYGNHDVQEDILLGFSFSKDQNDTPQADERMNEFIDKSGFKLLHDSYAIIENNIYIYGRPDKTRINLGENSRIEASHVCDGMNLDYPVICVEHEPSELHELASAGVDLNLSGHTHNGQIWPGTLTIGFFWENAYGKMLIDNMTSIVTSGVGLFGVNMRTGCYPEIANIYVKFVK